MAILDNHFIIRLDLLNSYNTVGLQMLLIACDDPKTANIFLH